MALFKTFLLGEVVDALEGELFVISFLFCYCPLRGDFKEMLDVEQFACEFLRGEFVISFNKVAQDLMCNEFSVFFKGL